MEGIPITFDLDALMSNGPEEKVSKKLIGFFILQN